MRLLSLNHYWRIAAAGLSYIVFAVGASLPAFYISALTLVPMSKEAKQRKARNAISVLCRFYVHFMQRLGLISFDIVQRQSKNLTSGELSGHIVTANHATLIDALFMFAYVDNLCCVVKSDLSRNLFTRLPVKLAGYLVNDQPDLIEMAAVKLRRGENILIFPEGTRNQSDLQLDFKRGISNIAIAAQAPILPVVIICTPRVLGKGDPWYQLGKVKSRYLIRFDPALQIDDCVDRDIPRTLQYRRLTQWLRDYYHRHVSELVDAEQT